MSKSIENEEDEFFEDDKKSNKLGLIIAIVTFVFIVGAVFCFLFIFLGKKDKPDTDNVDATVVDYSENDVENTTEDTTEIFDRTEEETKTPEPTPEPTPTPLESEEVEEEPLPVVEGPIMELDVKDYSKVKYNTKTNLSEMEGYFNENNLDALYDLAHLDRFIAMSYAYKNTTDFAYYGDVNSEGQPDGKGIAVYADNQYYCGEWKNGLREGSGVWIHYHIHLKTNLKDPITFHEYIGNFKNDLPNGHGQDHYEYDSVLLVKNTNYITNYMCNFVDGLIDGEVYATSTDKNGTYNDYNGTATKGSLDYISASRDDKKRGPALTNAVNPDSYYWIAESENHNIGVVNYISAYK